MCDFQTQLKTKENCLMKHGFKYMHLFIFFYGRAHQNLSQDLVYLKQHIFYQNNLIIPIHLSQVKHIFLNLCVYLACPKLIWTVT